jgi:nitrite reductase (NADH) large subunit
VSAHRLVIIGNGMAGARLAENLVARARADAFEIAVFGDEPGGSYNRILLSGVLAGTHAGGDILLNPLDWYARHGITLHSGTAAATLDVGTKTVIDSRGNAHPFHSAVLATGASPVIPPIAGLTARDGPLRSNVFVFRTVDDCARIAIAAARARRAVVLGGGLLGLEAARGLLCHGLDVTVVHLGPHAMDAQLDRRGGRILQSELERFGVRLLTNRKTTRVIGAAAVNAVEFSDGSHLACDLLVIAAGVRPNTGIAAAAGLATGRGIVVDDALACPGVPGIYALGDCIEHRDQVYGLVAPAWEQADVLADRLSGRRPDAVYTGSVVTTKLKVAGLDVAAMGARDEEPDDEVVCYSEPSRGIYGRLLVRDDRLAGAIVIGLPEATAAVVQRFLDGTPAPSPRSELLFPPIAAAARRAVADLPDSARICDCNAVTKSVIVDAVLNGARSLSAVCAATRAGTGCGSCRPEVQRIVDDVCRGAEPMATPVPAMEPFSYSGGGHGAA